VDVFVPSIEEILFMLEPDTYRHTLARTENGDMLAAIPADVVPRLAERMLAMGVKVLLIKAGHRGAYLRTGDLGTFNAPDSPLRLSDGKGCPDGTWIPPFPVEPERFCNACGAGDCAVAGFLSALLNDVTIEEAGHYAMLAGRDNLYGQDALSGLREWSHMTSLVKERG
jgi:sugar/nucleoside kinase (ribokinase family)